jgi:hypothetical protein
MMHLERQRNEWWPWLAPLVPEQLRGPRQRTPEERLMAAVLEDALRELTRPGGEWRGARSRRHAEVQLWFGSDDVAWPFSFVNVCEVLDLDPDEVRSSIGLGAPRLRRAGRG